MNWAKGQHPFARLTPTQWGIHTPAVATHQMVHTRANGSHKQQPTRAKTQHSTCILQIGRVGLTDHFPYGVPAPNSESHAKDTRHHYQYHT